MFTGIGGNLGYLRAPELEMRAAEVEGAKEKWEAMMEARGRA